ncbi:MAG: glycosyltransferase family 4 protein [Ferruginibacter sp.]
MKRLLFISSMNGAPWGGSEEFWFHMAQWMSAQGHQVECCFFDWPQGKDQKKTALKNKGCTLHPLPNPKHAKNYLHKILVKRRIKKQLMQLVQQNFDLICFSQGGLLDLTYPPFNHLLPFLKRFVIIYHNYNDVQILSNSRKRKIHNWSQAALQNMVAAEKIFSVVPKIAGFKLPLGHLLKNPITIPVQEKPCPWPALSETGDYTWVVIGQLDVQRKAQDILIKALAGKDWTQRNWQLHIYGDGPDKALLENLISNLQLHDKVFLKGFSANVEMVLKDAHLLLQITHLDAMPLSVTEAMNMARACIVSNVGDMPLWIGDGEQGFVVPALSEKLINDTLERAWQQKDNWQQLGVNAFQKFRENYPAPYELYYENYLLDLIKD